VKKIILVSLVICLVGVLSVCAWGEEKIKIGVVQIIDHPALNAVRDGLMDALKEVYGYIPGENIEYDVQSAQGDMATANTIAQKFVSEKVDLIVSIATPASQAAVNATKEIPVVFSAVTDPVSSGLVSSLENPGGNVTGVSDMVPVDKQMYLIKYLFPDTKKVGNLYNSGEVNSVVTNDMAKAACAELGMEILEATVATTADVSMAARSLVGKIDAIYVATDNTVISALDTVTKICADNKIPLFLADPTTVSQGALLALGFDYYLHGRQTADLVARILKGENPGEISVEFAKKLTLLFNPQTVKMLGLDKEEFAAKLNAFVEDMKAQGVEVSLESLPE
jgi:putative ABC transport system substrate-binding protein